MRITHQPIEPIRKRRQVPLQPDRAFDLFTAGMHRWWPLATHSIGGVATTGVRFEGRIGGRVVEVTEEGEEYVWAEVIAWDPPHRFVLAWHPQIDPVAASTLEVVFRPIPSGTEVALQHRGWEEFGEEIGYRLREEYDPGWEMVLAPFETASANTETSWGACPRAAHRRTSG